MKLDVQWNEGGYTTDVAPTESDIWKEVAKNLPDIPIPNTLKVITDNGNASLTIRKRGTYIKNGVTLPSMYVVPNYNLIQVPSSTYPEAYLTCVNPESNNYKFYHLKPGITGIGATYGRIGSERGEMFGVKDLQQPYEPYLYWIRYYEKLSKGYVDASDIYLATKVKATKKKKTTPVKTQNANPVSAELYRKLKAYAKYVVNTTLKNSDITQAQIDKSKFYLKEMGKRKTVNGFNNQLQKLLMVCPRKARYVNDLLATNVKDFPDIIAREENLIAAMEALVYDDGIPVAQQAESFDSMGIEVYYATTEQKAQVLSHLNDGLKPKVKNIYRVIHKAQQKRFNDYLKNHHIKKVKQLWHGSKNENWFSILTNGLQLNPNARITGKMFGQGIYFAPSAQKSWGYTSFYGTRWANGKDDTAFMGLYATAYGKPLDAYTAGTYTQKWLNSQNCDCVHAHAGQALLNDEIIYYSESAMVCNYIVEFG